MKTLLILGAYGGVGQQLCQVLLNQVDGKLILAGRDRKKLDALAQTLRNQHPKHPIACKVVEAEDKEGMVEALQWVDLMIVCASVADHIETLAEAALESGTDMLDILLRGDVVDTLTRYEAEVEQEERIFITQAGFHPGLIAPMIRLGSAYFEDYQTAKVVMAMDAIFKQPEAADEIIYELMENKAQLLEAGNWRRADYTDAVKVEFSDDFGKKQCYPLQMRELYGLERELGLAEAGAYAAGFDGYIDNFIFPFAMMMGKINRTWSRKLSTALLFKHIKKSLAESPKVELQLQAQGLHEGAETDLILQLRSDNGFELTAQAVVACVKQYLNGQIKHPGLYLMGQVLNVNALLQDFQAMGVNLHTQLTPH